MKKKFVLLLIILVGVFGVNWNVEAAWGSAGGTGSGNSGTTSDPSSGVVEDSDGNRIQGVRLTVYKYNDSNNTITKLGHSIDIIRTKSGYDKFASGDQTFYRTILGTGKKLYSKYDYINSSTYSKYTQEEFKKLFKKTNNKTHLYYKGQTVTVNGSSYKVLNGFNFPVIYGPNAVTDSQKNFKANFDYYLNNSSDYKRLLALMGVANYECSNTYIVAEALALVYLSKGNRYLGTAYELAIFRYNYYLSNVLGHDLPFALYVGPGRDNLNFIGDYVSVVKYNKGNVKDTDIRRRNGYGVNIFWLGNVCVTIPTDPEEPDVPEEPTPEYCNYDNPDHFTTTSSGPNGENCCDYFKNDPSHPNLAEDYPQCGSCPAITTKTTIIDEDGNNSGRCSTGSSTCSSVNTTSGSTSITVTDNMGINNNTCLPVTDNVDITKSKVQELKINDYCSIKCVEEDTFSIPKDPKVTVNTYHFVWPTSPSTTGIFGNSYPLTASGKVSCRIIVRATKLKAEKTVDQQNSILNDCSNLKNIQISDINKFNPKITLSHTDTKGNKTVNNSALEKYNEHTTCASGTATNLDANNVDCNLIKTTSKISGSNFDAKVASLRDYRFSITKSMGYKLSSTLNTYVDKSNTSASSIASGVYTVVGYGNIPIDFMSSSSSLTLNDSKKVSGKLNLSIDLNSNHFSALSVNSDFTCAACYEAKYDNSSSTSYTKYYCRAGTNNAGKDISGCIGEDGIINNDCVVSKCSDTHDENHYCSATSKRPGHAIADSVWNTKVNEYKSNGSNDEQAQILAQDYFDNSDECSGQACDPSDPKCCDNPSCPSKCDPSDPSCNTKYICPVDSTSKYSGMDITSCVDELNFESIDERIKACQAVKCNDIPDGPGDPGYTCPPGTTYENWDIGICVINSKANNLAAAKQLCITAICNAGESGPVVIYRPIVLDNPFPSITGVGRLPGANWNISSSNDITRQAIVKKYITSNRGEETEDVYDKTPLYTFELKPSTIKKIRNYNRNHDEYDDFGLRCHAGRECISDSRSNNFVHNTEYGFVNNSTKSTCTNTAYDQFYKCLE